MNLNDYRMEIDALDKEIVALIEKRMDVSKAISEYKYKNNLPILDENREAELIKARTAHITDDAIRIAIESVFKGILKASRDVQQKSQARENESYEK